MSDAELPRLRLDPVPGLQRPLELFTHDPAGDLVSRKLHGERAWEVFESRLWLASHRPGDIVVDVGANLGYYSLLSALGGIPVSRVFAFEPAADNYALLCDNLTLNGAAEQVLPVRAALGEAAGPITLHRSAHNLGDHQVYAGDGERDEETVAQYNGAEFLSEFVDRVDLLKLDTQGSELSVLRGLLPLLRRSRNGLRLLIELTPFSLAMAGHSGRALIELLDSLDLPLFIVDHQAHELVPSNASELAQWCDNVADTDGDRGFMNIFAGPAPAL